VAQSVISDLETGENTNPSWDVLSKLSQVYDRRPEALIRHVRLPARAVVSAIMEHHSRSTMDVATKGGA
jgi:transcriptional regulator with XRE-family HTH domain